MKSIWVQVYLIWLTVSHFPAKYWERLLADDNKPGWLKIDFDRWRGEDDSEDERQDEITVIILIIRCTSIVFNMYCLPSPPLTLNPLPISHKV